MFFRPDLDGRTNIFKIHARSKSVSTKYGWQPLFLSAWSENDLIACAPLYLKSHSYGEFIFDNAFVQLAQDMGLQYYPKLIGMSPLSPIEGYRFLFAEGVNDRDLTQILISEIDSFAKQNGILSCNFLYVDPKWMKVAESLNCAKWVNQQSLLKLNDIKYFDPGAGGSHKKRRGFIAKPNASLHRWYNLPMDSLIREWLPRANKLMLDQINATNNEVPFKFEEPKLSNT